MEELDINKDFIEFKDICSNILQITLHISENMGDVNLQEINICLEQREELIQTADNLKSVLNFSQEEQEEIQSIIRQIKEIDDDNISKLQDKYNLTAKEIFTVSKNTKAVSAYKINKQIEPRLFDESN